jgi:hypothetical protein
MLRDLKTADDLDDFQRLLEEIRQHTAECLERVSTSAQVAAALTYVAAEMSLQLAPNPVAGLPILLEAISEATRVHEDYARIGSDEFVSEIPALGARTIH